MRGPALIPIVLLATALLLAGCSDQPERPRKQQTLKLLPDTPPPPPPPPPKPEEKPPPKAEDKPQPQAAPKPLDTPQPQVLKSDEAAGQGPGNGLTAGTVTQDYVDQKQGQGTGTTVGGAAPIESGASRMAANVYGNAASRTLNEFLLRDKTVKLRDYKVRVQLWLTATGSLQRAELVDSTGDPQTDEALRSALDRFPGTSTPPPARVPQPIRVLVSNRLLG